ncbi:MAG: hypothetical protein WAK01_08805, partial [Methylocystis sp.]
MSDVPGGELRFESSKELEAWLKTQPHEVSVVIAARAALRALPTLSRWAGRLQARRFAQVAFATFWANASARVAARYPMDVRVFDNISASFAAGKAVTNAAAIDPSAASPA